MKIVDAPLLVNRRAGSFSMHAALAKVVFSQAETAPTIRGGSINEFGLEMTGC